jgi:ribonuclease P protein component
MALPKKNRITAKDDFRRLFREGKTVQNSFFFIRYLANGRDFARWGIVVPVSVSKKSVDRNRIKRRMSEALKLFLNLPLDAVITATPIILEKSFDEIKGQIEKNIKKISVNPVREGELEK